jgi:RNA polymerase sigma-70 factor (ECF subfamily)
MIDRDSMLRHGCAERRLSGGGHCRTDPYKLDSPPLEANSMKLSSSTNAELLRACVDTGAVEAWAEFIARFQPMIAGVIARIVARLCGHAEPSIVDDLIQETYLRLCRKDCKVLREFHAEHEGSFFGYLKDVASSVARDHFRAQSAARRGPQAAPLDEAAERQAIHRQGQADKLLIDADIWQRLESIVESERDIVVFRLYYQQGFTSREIAALPDIRLSEKGVESCLYRLVGRLKAALNSREKFAGKSPDITFGDVG